MKKVIIVVFAVLAAASVAKAEGINMDFDGGKTDRSSFAVLLKVSAQGQNDKISPPEPVFDQEKAETGDLLGIRISMNNGAQQKTEILLCRKEDGKLRVQACKKQSDGLVLSRKDAMDMVLQGFFPSDDFGAFPMSLNRHSYCNQSGPEYFSCHDVHVAVNEVEVGKKVKYITECGGKIEASYSGFPTISGEIGCSHRTEEEILYENHPYDTHECEKVDHC